MIEKLNHTLRDEDLNKILHQHQNVQDEVDEYFFNNYSEYMKPIGLHIKDLVAGLKVCKDTKTI